MKLYMCYWPDGDVTAVLARNKEEALDELDELGEATIEMLTETRSFMVTFAPKEIEHPDVDQHDFEWGVSQLGECMEKVLPNVSEAVAKSGAFPLGGDDLKELDDDPTGECDGNCADCTRHDQPDYDKVGTGPMAARLEPAILAVAEVFDAPLVCSPALQRMFARNVEHLCYGLSQIPNCPPASYLMGIVRLDAAGRGICALFSRQSHIDRYTEDAQLVHRAEAGRPSSANHLAVLLIGPEGKEAHIVDVPKVLRAFNEKRAALALSTSPGSTESN